MCTGQRAPPQVEEGPGDTTRPESGVEGTGVVVKPLLALGGEGRRDGTSGGTETGGRRGPRRHTQTHARTCVNRLTTPIPQGSEVGTGTRRRVVSRTCTVSRT